MSLPVVRPHRQLLPGGGAAADGGPQLGEDPAADLRRVRGPARSSTRLAWRDSGSSRSLVTTSIAGDDGRDLYRAERSRVYAVGTGVSIISAISGTAFF